MSAKVDTELALAETALGVGGRVEVVPILIPLMTYHVLLQAGKDRGLSVSDVMAHAIELFLMPKQDITSNIESLPNQGPTVNFRRPRK